MSKNTKTVNDLSSKVPAAACPRCGGWTSFGGCSQHSNSIVPVMGRTGCTCQMSATKKAMVRIVRDLREHERMDREAAMRAAREDKLDIMADFTAEADVLMLASLAIQAKAAELA